MLFFWGFVSVLALLASAANTTTNSTSSLQSLVASLPSCALVCLSKALSNSTCLPTDQQCICTNAPFNAEVRSCVQASCTIKQSLVTLNVTSTLCGDPIRDRRLLYDVISNVFGALSGVAVVLRLFSRYLTGCNLWYDDYAILLTMVIGIPSFVISVHGLTSNGLGKDIWTLSFRNISDMIHVFFAAELLYFAELALVKISILFFYLRLFPSTTIRRVIYGTIVFNVLFLAVFDLTALLQCQPINYYWKKWDGEHEGKCLNNNALAWSNAGINIAADLWLLGLPMTQLIHLQLHWKKKLGVVMMFGVGAFVTIVSILRLQSILLFSNSQNPTWDYVAVGYWSTIEINVGIICSCMPSIRLLLVRAFPKALSAEHNKPKYTNDDSWASKKGGSKRYGMYSKNYDINHGRSPTAEFGPSTLELVTMDRKDTDL